MATILFALALANTPLFWEVKDGCLENSTVFIKHEILYSDDRACSIKHNNTNAPFFKSLMSGQYAWGACTNEGIKFGFGSTREECMGSMNGTDGYHQLVIPPHSMDPGSCYCHKGNERYDSFTCVKEEPIALQSEAEEDPKPHTYHSDYGITVFFVVFITLPIIFILMMP